jgi:hypothetical protein
MFFGLNDVAFLAAASAAPALWTPADIATALWLDAADASTITESGGTVSQLNDKSGNNLHVSQSNVANQPTSTGTQNGLTVLGYSGSQYLTAAAAANWTFLHNATGSSIFVVCKPGTTATPDAGYAVLGTNNATSANVGYYLFHDNRNSASRLSVLDVAVTRGVANQATSRILSGNGFWPVNAWGVMGIISDPANATASARLSARLTGGAALETNTFTNTLSTANPISPLQIGASGNNTSPLTGSIGEVVIVSGLISSSNRQKMEGYLAHKWGLTADLPNDHPYKTAAPTV